MSMTRRELIAHTAVAGATAAAAPALPTPTRASSPTRRATPWPNGARLAISISMQFEAGAQPERGASGPFPPIDPRYPDLPTTTWYQYGYKEGIPRLLDVFDRQGVKVTSHMVGAAVEQHPALAREIVQRGHEAAAHGQTWTPQFSMTREQEKASYEANIQSILRATGTRPVGFNAFWLRGTPETLPLLQELGFLYHIDDVSRDEPFLIPVRGKPFVVVPYTLSLNDIMLFEERHFSADQFASELKSEFDALYAESATRRRMMSISMHDRIGGRPARARVLEEFITYAKRQPGVWFARKDELARMALESPLTPREDALAASPSP